MHPLGNLRARDVGRAGRWITALLAANDNCAREVERTICNQHKSSLEFVFLTLI